MRRSLSPFATVPLVPGGWSRHSVGGMPTEAVDLDCAATTADLLSLTLLARKADLEAMARPDATWLA